MLLDSVGLGFLFCFIIAALFLSVTSESLLKYLFFNEVGKSRDCPCDAKHSHFGEKGGRERERERERDTDTEYRSKD